MLLPSRQQNQRQFNPPTINRSMQQRSIQPSQLKPTTKVGGKGVMSGLTKTLDGVQQVLNMVQTSAPIVQEYGPMIKNLPAMYRMIKVFKEIEKSEGKEEVTETVERKPIDSQKMMKKTTPERHDTKSVPKPKLYI
ncbi:VrrA/YqfQ family protein [Oceanobacillus polygoni]|uniref:YqfQ-like protein n=1 Tax=Oceanobacillus polygoni TaxID=1235259 RepID=A0A9X0YTZ5_9BACI|nr:VrrA/YqfQ family protein [Oceanobacillus polygoni]MBP2078277.1 hypothetical protein [Oceanobacillus polygoni]